MEKWWVCDPKEWPQRRPKLPAPGLSATKPQKANPGLWRLYQDAMERCHYCRKRIPFREATKDHVVPRCRGGKSVKLNLVMACKKCNNRKGSMPYALFKWIMAPVAKANEKA